MSEKETGGPAFPRPAVFTEVHGLASVEQDGMTLRDHFAGLAMQGFITNHDTRRCDVIDIPQLANSAYRLADAMLEARNAN